MRTKQDYINGLSKMKRNIYFDGGLIDRTDELAVTVACQQVAGNRQIRRLIPAGHAGQAGEHCAHKQTGHENQ